MRGLYWILPSSMRPMFSIASRHLLLLLRHRRGSWANRQSQSALDTILCASYRPPPSIIYEKQGAPTGWVTFPAEGPSRAWPGGRSHGSSRCERSEIYGHGKNTEGTRKAIRVRSVFHQWLLWLRRRLSPRFPVHRLSGLCASATDAHAEARRK